MNIQERDYEAGMATEQQNAYALSCMEMTTDTAKIYQLRVQGRFVVAGHRFRYCHFTDASMGVQDIYIGDYHSREAAQEFCEEGDGEEYWEEVLAPFVHTVAEQPSEIPF